MRAYLFFVLLLLPSLAHAVTPDRFSLVSTGIFRSAQPRPGDYDTLAREYGIRTIVSLSDNSADIASETEGAAAAGIQFFSLPLDGFWAPSDAAINRVLAVLSNPAYAPVLVHCEHGRDRTGLVVGLYRVEHEGWSPKHAWREMLTRGFRRVLFPLEHYFRRRTGLSYFAEEPRAGELALLSQEAFD